MSKTECEQANKPEVNEKVDKELLQNAKVCFKKEYPKRVLGSILTNNKLFSICLKKKFVISKVRTLGHLI